MNVKKMFQRLSHLSEINPERRNFGDEIRGRFLQFVVERVELFPGDRQNVVPEGRMVDRRSRRQRHLLDDVGDEAETCLLDVDTFRVERRFKNGRNPVFESFFFGEKNVEIFGVVLFQFGQNFLRPFKEKQFC